MKEESRGEARVYIEDRLQYAAEHLSSVSRNMNEYMRVVRNREMVADGRPQVIMGLKNY